MILCRVITLGLQVTLLSSDDVTVGCSKTHPPGHVSMADIESALSITALCSVTTDAEGRYTFTGIPCGQYSLQVRCRQGCKQLQATHAEK